MLPAPPPITTKRAWLLSSVAIIALLLLVIDSTRFGPNIILRQYDALRLATFSRRTATADRVVASWVGSSVQLTFAGDELKKIIRGTSSGTSARMPDAVFMSSPSAKATFYRGTNILGHLSMGRELFAIDSGGPPFFDNGLLKTTIHDPLRQKSHEAYTTGTK